MGRVIGLTGGIGTGKSSVARLLSDRGVPVVDADQVAREVVEPGQPALEAIVQAFGEGLLGADGRLDRSALGERVFGDPEARATLEAITHPAIAQRSGELFARHLQEGHEAVVYEASLLVETGRHKHFDGLIVVTAPEAARIARVHQRDGLPEAAARARIAAQLPMADKVAVADVVILNDGSLEDLAVATDRAWAELARHRS
jgi:dephospho-CoA kinase